jgi:SAM-dependent methyltransferase
MSGNVPPAFDAHAGEYDRELSRGLSLTGENKTYYAKGRVQRLAELLAKRGEAVPRILDFGCGTGGAIESLEETFNGSEIVGTDPSAASLEIARAEHRTARFVGPEDYEAAGPFDLCHCNGVFHHIPPAKRDAHLAAIQRSLRPGGWIALFENNPLNPGTRWIMSRIPFDRDAITLTPRESVQRLRRAGFAIEDVAFLFFFPRALAPLRALEPLLKRVPLGGQYLVLGRRGGVE